MLSKNGYLAKNYVLVSWWNFSWSAMIIFSFINSVSYRFRGVTINSCFWKLRVQVRLLVYDYAYISSRKEYYILNLDKLFTPSNWPECKPFSQFSLPHHQDKAWTKIKRHDYTRHYGFLDFSFLFMWQSMTIHKV